MESATESVLRQRWFPLSKSRNAFATEAGVDAGEGQTANVQIKKVPTKISQAMLAVGHGFCFN